VNERAGNSEQLKRRILFGPGGHPWGGPRNGDHMPFPGHRTQQEVREDEARNSIKRVSHAGSRDKRREKHG
jgi:hypothetical protein